MTLTVNHALIGQIQLSPAVRPVEWITLSDFIHRQELALAEAERLLRGNLIEWKLGLTARYGKTALLVNAASYVP